MAMSLMCSSDRKKATVSGAKRIRCAKKGGEAARGKSHRALEATFRTCFFSSSTEKSESVNQGSNSLNDALESSNSGCCVQNRGCKCGSRKISKAVTGRTIFQSLKLELEKKSISSFHIFCILSLSFCVKDNTSGFYK